MNNTVDQMNELQHVIFISGGSVDDFVAFILLTTMNDIDFQAVIISNSDCIAGPAMELQRKISHLVKRDDIPIALSESRAWNPFPYVYRMDCVRFNNKFPKELCSNPKLPPCSTGEDLIEKLLSEAIDNNTLISMLVTSPITPLYNVLKMRPELERGIKHLIFMGGAIYVKGNLDPDTIPKEIVNYEAEWNVFWDPTSTAYIFEKTSFPIILFPLDVTNKAKIIPFLSRLKKQIVFQYSELVDAGYDQTSISDNAFYCMWNSLTASYISHPEFFDKPKIMCLKVITEGNREGAIIQEPSGREVTVVLNLLDGPDKFYDYVLNQLKQ